MPAALVLSVASVSTFVLTLDRTPVVWFDEVLFASASLSLAEGGRGVPTVVEQTQLSPPLTLFHGPVWFHLGALFFELFGFSIESYRALSLLGAAVTAISCMYLLRVLGGSRSLSLLCLALLLLSPELGSHATAGRMDALAVGSQLLGLAFFLASAKAEKVSASLGLTAAAGLSWAVAALTTPRSLPFLGAVGLCLPLLAGSRPRRRCALQCGVAMSIAALGVAAWAWSLGLSAWEWLGFVAAQSAGDAVNSSGLLGGRWDFRFSAASAATPLLITLVSAVLLLGRASRAGGRPGLGALAASARRVSPPEYAAAVLAVSAVLALCLISRPASHNLYWAVPLIPVLLVFSQKRFAHATAAASAALLMLWLAAGSSYAVVRALKLAEVAASWEQRDPERLERFFKDNVPPRSRVIGPANLYWYGAERSGSDYYYYVPHPGHLPGLTARGLPSPVATGSGREGREYARTYLIFPEDWPLPRRFESSPTLLVARFSPPGSESGGLSGLSRYSGGYPTSSLYLLLDEVRTAGLEPPGVTESSHPYPGDGRSTGRRESRDRR